MLTHMLTAVSHTGASRLRRVRTGQCCLLDHIVSRNNHRDKIYLKNPRVEERLNVTCVHREHGGEMKKKSVKRPLPAAPELSGLPPSWSLRNVAAGAPTSRSLTPYTPRQRARPRPSTFTSAGSKAGPINAPHTDDSQTVPLPFTLNTWCIQENVLRLDLLLHFTKNSPKSVLFMLNSDPSKTVHTYLFQQMFTHRQFGYSSIYVCISV